MNKKLQKDIDSTIGSDYQNIHRLKDFISKVESAYEESDKKIKPELNNNPVNAKLINTELQQNFNELEAVINNLRSAISSIDPKFQQVQSESDSLDEVTYLTNTLIELVENSEKAKKQLEQQKVDLIKTNIKLANEKAKDLAILQAIGDGLVVTDPFGKIILTNGEFEKILGWSSAEVMGKQLDQVVNKYDNLNQIILPEHRLHKLVIQTGKAYATPVDETFYFEKKDLTRFPVTITATPIIMNGNIIGVVEVFRDITKEKEIDKAKSEFVSLASHQLRTPLSSINWYTELLLDDSIEGSADEFKSYLGEISKASSRMVDMINALLNVSRLELGTLAMEPEFIDLKELITKIVNEFKPKLIQKKHKLVGTYNPTIPKIKSDPKLVSMIIQNLLSNAIKYTPENGLIQISANLINNKSEILIGISDNGYGIPENEQDKMFSKLYRASNIKKYDTDGNGLGLYIIKMITNNIGSRIWFTSKEEKGTTFFFTLPANEVVVKRQGGKWLS